MLAGLVLAGPTLRGQEPARSFPEQTTVFRRILFESRFQPLASFDDLDADSILIVLGDISCLALLDLAGKGLADFINDGGAVLIATDRPLEQGAPAQRQLQPFGVRVGPELPTWTQVDETRFYHGHPWCPLVEPMPAPSSAPALFQPFTMPAGLPGAATELPALQIATNTPAYLETFRRSRYRLHELARLPTGAVRVGTRAPLDEWRRPLRRWFDVRDLISGEKGDRWVGPLFAVGGQVGDSQGRILLLADPSIFSNGMIYRLDNRNLEFTSQCLHWLQEGGPEPRTKVLLVEDGRVVPTFEVRLIGKVPLPTPPQQAVVAALDETLANLEDHDALDEGLVHLIESRLPGGMPQLTRRGLLAVTLGLFLYACYRIGIRGLYRRDVSIPLLSEALAEHRPRELLSVQRRRAMQQAGNAWELARALARQCFVDLAPADPEAGPPRFVVAGRAWRRWRRCRRLRWLWRLAFAPTPLPVAPERLPRLVAELRQVQDDLRGGVIRVG